MYCIFERLLKPKMLRKFNFSFALFIRLSLMEKEIEGPYYFKITVVSLQENKRMVREWLEGKGAVTIYLVLMSAIPLF